MNYFLVYISFFSFLSSCSFLRNSDEILLARVGDSYLFESDIPIHSSVNLKSLDSIIFVQKYIRNWAEQKLLLKKAILNINQDELEISSRLSDYKNSLLIHAYEQKLIQQEMDTLITKENIISYYNNHLDDYFLSEKILKIMFVQTSLTAPKLDSLKVWMSIDNFPNVAQIEDYCHQYSKRFYYNPNEWVKWDEFSNIFPSDFNVSLLTMNDNFLVANDSLDLYLFRLIDLKQQSEIAPLDYVYEKIKSILLNKKKINTIELIKLKLFEDAKKMNEFEIF